MDNRIPAWYQARRPPPLPCHPLSISTCNNPSFLPTSLIEFSSPVSCFLHRDGKRTTGKSPPLEVSPAPADFYSSHTGFVYNFVPFVRSSRYTIDPAMYLRHFTLVLLRKLITWVKPSPFFFARRSLAASKAVRLQDRKHTLYIYMHLLWRYMWENVLYIFLQSYGLTARWEMLHI